MSRSSTSVPPDAIRIEDEVWQDAFARREPPRSRRLQAVAVPAAPPRWQEGPSPNAIGGIPGRKTITIRGHGAERNLAWSEGSRRRPKQRPYEREGFKPDRVAMWAVLLGILLVVVAVASAHG